MYLLQRYMGDIHFKSVEEIVEDGGKYINDFIHTKLPFFF